jgi:cell division protein FtsI/penicillin-binding protein 2
VRRVTGLRFAANTPYETNLECQPDGAERVFAPQVARALRKALVEVTERGTAARAKGLFRDQADPRLEVGGKTGTGDHRSKTFSAGSVLRDSRPVSRAGTFVFFAGEHLFGVVTAYVPGAESDRYEFTSSLPVQVLKHLEPSLRRLLERNRPQGHPSHFSKSFNHVSLKQVEIIRF